MQKRSLLKNLIGCSEQNILKKWLTFQWKKILVFCLALPSIKKLMETFVRVQDIFCHSLHKVKIVSVGPSKFSEIFFRKAFFSLEYKILVCFFSFYRVFTTSKTISLGSEKYSSKTSASKKISSVTTKALLNSQFFEKKAIFRVKKIIWPISTVITEYERPQVTN